MNGKCYQIYRKIVLTFNPAISISVLISDFISQVTHELNKRLKFTINPEYRIFINVLKNYVRSIGEKEHSRDRSSRVQVGKPQYRF